MKKKESSIYAALGEKIQEKLAQTLGGEAVDINAAIRRLRVDKKMTGAELCRRAGDLDPKTLTAVEKGRIKNPSIKTLNSVARGLGVTISDLFRQAEMTIDRHFYQGTQKGAFQMDFPALGLKAVSFTPFIREFFCGKLIFSARKSVDQTFLKHPQPIFISTLIGRFEVKVEDRNFSLSEGENLFFNGTLRHSLANPLQRESVLLMMTAPSFL